MKLEKSKQHKMTTLLLILYLIILAWIILFKMQFSVEALYQFTGFRSVNLVPFEGTAVYDGILDIGEITYNVLIFIPFGIYISMLKPNWHFLQKILPIAGVSLLFEVLQYIFVIGSSDITDFLGNTLGGIIGIGVYLFFRKIFKSKAMKALNILAILGTLAIFIFGLLLMFGIIQYGSFS